MESDIESLPMGVKDNKVAKEKAIEGCNAEKMELVKHLCVTKDQNIARRIEQRLREIDRQVIEITNGPMNATH